MIHIHNIYLLSRNRIDFFSLDNFQFRYFQFNLMSGSDNFRNRVGEILLRLGSYNSKNLYGYEQEIKLIVKKFQSTGAYFLFFYK